MHWTSLRFIRNFTCYLLLWLYAPWSLADADAACTSRIQAINVAGAEITKPQNLIKWSGLSVGQQVSARGLRKARQRIFDKGLYKDVSMQHGDLCAASITLTITIDEKIYHLVYPRLSRSGDGDVSTGIRYRGSNLFGGDQSMSIRYSEKEYATDEEEELVEISFEIPLVSEPYIIRWSVKSSETLINDSGSGLDELTEELNFEVGRDWLTNPFARPITVLADFRFENLELDGDQSQINTEPGNFNTVGISLEYDDIHEEKYRRFGRFYRLAILKGSSLLDSDFSATQLKAEVLRFYPLNAWDNLNARFILKLSSDKVFNEFTYAVGGFETTRGLDESSMEGNALWIANIEYVKGYPRWPSFRTALFSDISNVFEKSSTVNSDDWNATVGIGLRWKLRAFVKTDLVIDYAYDPDTENSRVYGSTSLLF